MTNLYTEFGIFDFVFDQKHCYIQSFIYFHSKPEYRSQANQNNIISSHIYISQIYIYFVGFIGTMMRQWWNYSISICIMFHSIENTTRFYFIQAYNMNNVSTTKDGPTTILYEVKHHFMIHCIHLLLMYAFSKTLNHHLR